MSRSLYCAGLAAFVCILVSGRPAEVRAEDPPDGDVQIPQPKPKRPVAVIELGDFKANRELAERLAVELNDSRELKPIDSSIAAGVLREEYKDEDADALKAAEEARRAAADGVTNYRFADALREADGGLSRLYSAVPTSKVLALSAELAFLYGAAKLGLGDDKTAGMYFRLARGLHAGFKPDSVRYLPEIVQAFEAAVKAPPTGTSYIGVRTAATRVYVDGVDKGPAPQQIDKVSPGVHLVWVWSADRDTHAQRIEVTAGKKEEVEIDAPEISPRKKFYRARLALKLAPDPAARAAEMQKLARMLDVKDAVLLTESNGKTIIQTWREGPVDFGTPGFSALHEHTPDEKPADIVKPLIPPKVEPPPRKPDPPFQPPLVVDTRRWYEKPRYQIAGGAGVVVLGIVIYALSTWERHVGLDTNPTFPTGRRDQ